MLHGLVEGVLWHHQDPSLTDGLHTDHHQSRMLLAKPITDVERRISTVAWQQRTQLRLDREMILQNH